MGNSADIANLRYILGNHLPRLIKVMQDLKDQMGGREEYIVLDIRLLDCQMIQDQMNRYAEKGYAFRALSDHRLIMAKKR